MGFASYSGDIGLVFAVVPKYCIPRTEHRTVILSRTFIQSSFDTVLEAELRFLNS